MSQPQLASRMLPAYVRGEFHFPSHLPRHFRRLFSYYTSRVGYVRRHPRRTHARTSVVRRKFQISRATNEKGPFGGRGEKRESFGACTRVRRRGKGSGRTVAAMCIHRDRRFTWDRWAGEQQVVPENVATTPQELVAIEIYVPSGREIRARRSLRSRSREN